MKLKLYLRLFQLSIMESSIYRTTNIIMFFVSLLFFILEILSGFVFYSYTDNIVGFTKFDYFNLILTGNIILNMHNFLFVLGIEKVLDEIVYGEMDYDFIRPINSFFYNIFNRVEIQSFISFLLYLVLQIYLFKHQNIQLQNMFVYLIVLIIGVWYMLLINILITLIVFYTDKASAVTNFIELFDGLGRKPKNIYPRPIKFIFTFILSYLIVYNLPIEILNNNYSIYEFIFFILFTILLTVIVYKLWFISVKRYQSAN